MGLRIKDLDNLKNQGATPEPEITLSDASPIRHDLVRKVQTAYEKNYLEAKRKAIEFRQNTIDIGLDGDLTDSIKLVEKLLPEGATLIEFQLPGESVITEEMIKKVRNKMNKKRDYTIVHKYGEVEVTVANDGTVWLLDNKDLENPKWIKMSQAGYPELPQD